MKFDGIGQEVLKQLLNFRAVALDSGQGTEMNVGLAFMNQHIQK